MIMVLLDASVLGPMVASTADTDSEIGARLGVCFTFAGQPSSNSALSANIINLLFIQASVDSSVGRILADRSTKTFRIHILRDRYSYCWRSSLKIVFVVETYAFFRNVCLFGISLLFDNALPIIEEEENTVALTRDLENSHLPHTSDAPNPVCCNTYIYGMGFVNDNIDLPISKYL
jgi:hypothetical protein